jgi:hypothetical protein
MPFPFWTDNARSDSRTMSLDTPWASAAAVGLDRHVVRVYQRRRMLFCRRPTPLSPRSRTSSLHQETNLISRVRGLLAFQDELLPKFIPYQTGSEHCPWKRIPRLLRPAGASPVAAPATWASIWQFILSSTLDELSRRGERLGDACQG